MNASRRIFWRSGSNSLCLGGETHMAKEWTRYVVALVVAMTLIVAGPGTAMSEPGGGSATSTPIKHLVVIFQENVSFDHYFGTYPFAANPPGEPAFHAKDDTPRVNNLETSGLIVNNPNGANPFRIDRSVPNTCDQDHSYGDEQKAFHGGLMDNFLFDSCKDPVL